jgi:hypothetical protein
MSNIRDRSSSDDDDDFTHETNRKRDEVGAPLREIKYKGKEGGKGGKDRTTSTPRWRSIPGLTNKVKKVQIVAACLAGNQISSGESMHQDAKEAKADQLYQTVSASSLFLQRVHVRGDSAPSY